MSPVSLTYWGVPGYAIFWCLNVLAAGLLLRRARELWRYLGLGRGWDRPDRFLRRLPGAFFQVVLQWCQFRSVSRRDAAGLGHVLMAWGFFLFVSYYFIFIVIGAGLGISGGLERSSFFYYAAWVIDVAAPLVVLAALWGIVRRYVVRPGRLKGEQTAAALVILVTVLIHPVTHLLKEASGIALGQPPAGLGAGLPAFGFWLSRLFAGQDAGAIQNANIAFFWAHWGTVLFVLVFIAYSRYLHILAAPFNILFRHPGPRGALQPVDLAASEGFGVSAVTDFTRKQLLECYSCVECGRCQDACPAYATGKPLNPKQLVRDIKRHLLKAGPGLLGRGAGVPGRGEAPDGRVVPEVEIRACTTCGACLRSCPVGNDPAGMIVGLRRGLVYEGRFERGQESALQRVARDYNPWGIRWHQRAGNTGIEEARAGEKYDCIYWLGCVAAFDDRFREVARATANIMRAAGLKFATLGAREKCCGDFVRRLGDEGLYRQLAAANIMTLREFDFDFVLTHCPHCFNTLKNEYPQSGGNFKVVHHAQLIHSLIEGGRVRLQGPRRGPAEKTLYHDPCYLGRYNNIYKEPRRALEKVLGRVAEFPRNRSRSFCCGAGGGNVWQKEEPGRRISFARLEEALKIAPQAIATACPYCFLMFQEAFQVYGKNDEIKLNDISEIIERSLIID